MKRLFSILLAVMFIMSMTVSVSADTSSLSSDSGRIVIQKAPQNAVYKVYRMFELEEDFIVPSENDNGVYHYVLDDDSPWVNFVNEAKFSNEDYTDQKYFETYDDNGITYVRLARVDDSTISLSEIEKAELARAAIQYIKDCNNDDNVNNDITEDYELNYDNGFKAENIPLGYYVIESSIGVLCALTTTDRESYIIAKNQIPGIEKEVLEDSTNEWGSENTAEIGDTITFRTSVTIPAGTEHFSIHDALEETLDLNKPQHNGTTFEILNTTDFKVIYHTEGEGTEGSVIPRDIPLKGKVIDTTGIEGVLDDDWVHNKVDELNSDDFINDDGKYIFDFDNHFAYGLIYGHSRDNVPSDRVADCTFEVVFSHEFLNYLTQIAHEHGDYSETANVTVEYSAVLNEDAYTDTMPNENKAIVQYGRDSWTENVNTKTYTYTLDVVKTDDNDNLLKGAIFELYKTEDGGDSKEPVYLKKDGVSNYLLMSEAEVNALSDTEKAEHQKIAVNGEVYIIGLDDDDTTKYYLREIQAPKGYNKLEKDIEIEPLVTDNNTLHYAPLVIDETSGKYVSGGLVVVNQAGTLLPETGGIGTTIFYAAGGIMVVGAFVLLITKKRMGNRV